MPDASDMDLLRDYSRLGSEAAFAQLARRYVDYVFSAAFRVLKDASLAEDATQTVFLLLSRRAGMQGRLPT